jgi:hypothetical protein
MLLHPMDAHLNGILKVHLPSETHIAVAKADDVVIDGLVALLSNLSQFNDREVLLHGNKVFLEDILHSHPTSNGSNR